MQTISHVHQHERPSERRLRAGILHLGGLLHWDTRTVARFALAVTGHPWNRCGRADLVRVLDAYLTLAQRVRAVQATQPDASRRERSAQ